MLPGGVVCLWTRGQATTGDVVLVSSLGFAILHGTCDLAVMPVDMTQHVARQADAAQFLLVPDGWRKRSAPRSRRSTMRTSTPKTSTSRIPGRRCAPDHSGQRVGLAGSSGAGKSAVLTLLHDRAIGQPARAPVGQDSVQINNPVFSRCFACSL
ncbi:hypothetical protein C2L64_48750 [Paraburkholderia hospita]|uniref:ABC transporter domain-containing protein n=1 Tax=Paraburkholderia hospita TaxID=169430 RepID=A0AAN1JMN8_9BURK|nr:hypothetical protein C2L64_48750 [Paraburkholderia hospita]